MEIWYNIKWVIMQLKGELEKGGKDMIDMTNFKKSVKPTVPETSNLEVFDRLNSTLPR